MTNLNDTTPLGRHWRALVYVLNICRFSLIVLVTGIILLNVGQGQDLILSVGEDNRYVLLLGSTFLWAFSIWLWTRTLLEIRFPDACVDQALLTDYRRWLPRLLPLLAFTGVAFAAKNAGGPAEKFFWPTLVCGIIFTYLISKRRPIARWAAKTIRKEQADHHWLHVSELRDQPPLFADWQEAWQTKIGKLASVFMVLGVVMFIWGLASPISMGNLFNTLMLLMVWGATFLPIGSAITYYANKSGVPALTILLVMAVVFSLWNDNHAIRNYNTASTKRPSMQQGMDAWIKDNCTDQTCKPFLVVATAGGGIRAGYWTGTVLGYLHRQKPVVKHQLFAISGVSGGSVGSAVYRGVISEAEQARCKGKVLECTLQVLAIDYLAPVSASLLYPDMLQRFLPVALLSDRAKTLEISWEQGFKKVTGTDLLAGSFSALSKTEKYLPALFLNSTWSNNGRRIVASSLAIKGANDFNLANDQLDVIGYDIRLSTAAHNSARFPYVSPPGSWHNKASGKIAGRLQDGGLFENYGAETAMEILTYAKDKLGKRFKPMVVLISSDPTLEKDLAISEPGKVVNLGYEVMTTFRTTFATRVGRGAELASQLKNWTISQYGQDSYAYFRMCNANGNEADPPLGWSLSRRAQRMIQGYLLDEPVNMEKGEGLIVGECRGENQAAAQVVWDKVM